MLNKQKLPILLIPVWLGMSATQASDLTFNGFVSVVGGTVLDSEERKDGAYGIGLNCPCYIADYPNVGVYGDEWTFDPDTTLGVQFNYKMSDDVSATVQIVSNGAEGYNADVEWAYLSYNLNDSWTLQAGRKRLPLFYYSDFFDVGYAYPWIRAPGDLYGWQITGYDGMNLQYVGNWGDFNVMSNIWVGRDDDKNNALLSKVYYWEQIDETWKNMIGGYLDLTYEWLNIRGVVMRNEVSRYAADGTPKGDPATVDLEQFFYGLSVNIDAGNFVFRSEINKFVRPYDGLLNEDGEEVDDNIYDVFLVGVGWRFGDWLPMITHSSFDESSAPYTATEVHHTSMFSLRWDFTSSVAFKLQYDIFQDRSPEDWFVGDSKTIALGFDAVF